MSILILSDSYCSNNCTDMDCLYTTSLIFQIIGTIITCTIGIITVINLVHYLRRKKIDALFGFYSRLFWYLKTLNTTLGGLIDEGENSILVAQNFSGVNVLLSYSENQNLRFSVREKQQKVFEECKNGIINLYRSDNNQIPLAFRSKKELKQFNNKLAQLFNDLSKFPDIDSESFLYDSSITEDQINNKALSLRENIVSIIYQISKLRNQI